jgi:hypothetical protein
MSVYPRPALVLLSALLFAAIVSPAAHAAWNWPLHNGASKAKHSGKTLQPVVQHPIRIGNQRRAVKPIGSTRPAPKTILAKRPP